MTQLHNALQQMGLSALDFSEHEHTFLDQFLNISAPLFDKICQHRPDKPSHDLILGLLTKSHQEALDNFRATEPKTAELKAMFSDKIGAEHADKFTELSHDEVTIISTLWFMAQGYTGIDYSYANDHAVEIAEKLNQDVTAETRQENTEQYRNRFMKAYYTGIDFARKESSKNKRSANFVETIKNGLKRLLGNR
ncbi:hypothetical protein ACQKP8_15500 [Photobacterium alginatilyticum]|uniref:hypothetical protein n=1 Tax=Photobacterium alginatilyticum TaxID=1775171 RepID=UPI004068E57E